MSLAIPASAAAASGQNHDSNLNTQNQHATRPFARRENFRAHIATGSAVTFYISSAGSDSNSGTSPSNPWKTVSKVNRTNLLPGQVVLFQGGQTFSDDTLMPRTAGTGAAPIVFSSYGTGQATITNGVWFIDQNYLTFDNLKFGPQDGFQGGRDASHAAGNIVVEHCTIDLTAGNSTVGIYSYGKNWTIDNNLVENIGNSGMLLNGANYMISGNTINKTGLDAAIPFGKHGIYLKVSAATVTHNTITNFSSDGISPRFRNSTITGNHISGGATGIGFFQYDPIRSTSHWTNNTITNVSSVGIYVNGGSGGLQRTQESFVINGNTIQSTGQVMNLDPTRGTYAVSNNH